MVSFIEYDNDDMYHDYSAEIFYNDKGELSGIQYEFSRKRVEHASLRQ